MSTVEFKDRVAIVTGAVWGVAMPWNSRAAA